MGKEMLEVHPLHTGNVRIDRALSHSTTAPNATRDSVARIRRSAAESPEGSVQFGHDPATWHATSREILAFGAVGEARIAHAA